MCNRFKNFSKSKITISDEEIISLLTVNNTGVAHEHAEWNTENAAQNAPVTDRKQTMIARDEARKEKLAAQVISEDE